jgi:hypothetical protein
MRQIRLGHSSAGAEICGSFGVIPVGFTQGCPIVTISMSGDAPGLGASMPMDVPGFVVEQAARRTTTAAMRMLGMLTR